MKKPVKKLPVGPALDFNEIMQYVEKKYGFNHRDYAGSDKNKDAPYQDYWHHLLDGQFAFVERGTVQYWNLEDMLDEEEDTPEWVKTITQYVYDEFVNELDADGGFEVWVNW